MGGSRGGRNGKRRFSDEQIKTLEVMFGSESKPEPRTKQQLASDLGLHPRQVAIWFQNRRARLKSKHIEREYGMLKASYDALDSKFKILTKENQVLAAQVQNLRGLLEQVEVCKVDKGDKTDRYLSESNEKPTYISKSDEYKIENALVEACISNTDWVKREDDILNLGEPVDSSLSSSENSWDSRCFLDQTCSSSLLWEFWS